MLRRMRRGSKYQVRIRATSSSTIAKPTLASSEGITFSRNETVSASITIRSTKLTVISSTSCLNREIRINSTSQASDIAAATAGRPNSTIQQKLKKPQERRNASCGTGRDSVMSRIASAARCSTTKSATRPACARTAETSDRRVVRETMAGGMAFCRTRARLLQSPPGGGRCHQTVIKASKQVRGDLPPGPPRPAVNAQAGAARFIA